jgi:hypothetical protein
MGIARQLFVSVPIHAFFIISAKYNLAQLINPEEDIS